jgi:MFS family permease
MRVFFAIQSCLAVAGGIVLPFYILALHEAGNTALTFAGLYAIFTLAGTVTYLLTGSLLKLFSYRTLLIVSNSISCLALLSLTTIDELWQLAVIQVMLGAAFALQKNLEKIILAEYSPKKSRIEEIGNYHAFISIVLAFSIIGAGWLIDTFSIIFLFYGAGGLYLLAAIFSYKIKI